MALCRRIIRTIPCSSRSLFTSSSSVSRSSSSRLCRGARPIAFSALTDFTNRFPTFKCMSTDADVKSSRNNISARESLALQGCDFEHWYVLMEIPQGEPTRDEIIDCYIKTLSKVLGSEEEARMRIYSVSTKHYFSFGALVSEELSEKIKELPGVQHVCADSYVNAETKEYGGEPFINGKVVPYDPKYHEQWLRSWEDMQSKYRQPKKPGSPLNQYLAIMLGYLLGLDLNAIHYST
ncbi:hypothetical protein MKW94_022885 [Papaver nudicaule]|uniref:MORF/ORRM1/DAG-like MORF domain-containing protein n=1 Tax=Papaver nudicaule TaxID=74823 RepID=A0AA41S097_PAPNU|nr:hypothetical protein [Papaver nudicaule]